MKFPKLTLQLNALPPALVHTCLHVRAFMQENTLPPPTQTPVIVGMSGGADSTALALILRILGYPVHLAHLDHALRPESTYEADHVKAFAEQYAMPCSMKYVDVQALAIEEKIGIEEAGRHARYSFFTSLQNMTHPTAGISTTPHWLATGHHANDLAEDMLMRLLRGTGWPALGGMRACIAEKHLMRPLLSTSKDEIIHWLTSLEMPWCHDKSNDSPASTRNRIRHHIMPLCLEENPHFLTSITNIWTHAQDDHAYWTQRLTEHMTKVHPLNGGFLLPRNVYKNLEKSERLRLYKHLLERIPTSPRASTLFALDKARFTSGKCFQYAKACVHVTPEGLHFVATPEGLPL